MEVGFPYGPTHDMVIPKGLKPKPTELPNLSKKRRTAVLAFSCEGSSRAVAGFFSLVLFCFGRVEFRRAMAMCGTWCCGALVSVGDVLCVYGMNSVAILGLGVSGSFGVRIPT